VAPGQDRILVVVHCQAADDHQAQVRSVRETSHVHGEVAPVAVAGNHGLGLGESEMAVE
jgi:hypothetical protein